jgi:hypothetical protein
MSPRRTQGAVLIGGAALLHLLVEVGGLPFEWTPLLVGLEPRVEALGMASTYAAALAVVGLIRLAGPELRPPR